MKSTHTGLKAACAWAAVALAGFASAPAHAGLLGNGVFDTPEASDSVMKLIDGSAPAMSAADLACAASPDICRDKAYGASGSDALAGGASSAFKLGFMQSVGSVQVSPQYGLSFVQAGPQAGGGEAAARPATASPERWEVTYGASSQPAAAVTSVDSGAGWSLGSMQFQATSAAQVQTYMARGPSGLMGNSLQIAPMTPVPFGTPEPSALLLVGVALAGLWVQRRRQQAPQG